ncbi:MAG: AI-2E family transporter [Candidatus Nanohaloarchaea archaeon]|nr:AI-2E family transporter [Candidatus Nanohaloarchaea archaeon]
MDERWRFFLLAGLLAVSGYIVWPFADALIFGFVTAYGLDFLMERLEKFVDNKMVEWGIIVSVFILLALGLYLFFSNTAYMVSELVGVSQKFLSRLGPWINSYTGMDISGFISSYLGSLQSYVSSRAFAFASTIPGFFLELFVYFLVTYFVYRRKDDIEDAAGTMVDMLPEEEHRVASSIIESVGDLLKNLFAVYGTLAVIIGAVSALGYYFIGIIFLGHPLPFFWLWAFLTALAAFLRGVASGVFLGPIVAYYFVIGEFWFALSLALFSIIFLWIVPEAFLLPYLGAKKINESYIVMILGFLAGPLVFGFKGIVLGPVFIITLKNMVVDYFYSSSV